MCTSSKSHLIRVKFIEVISPTARVHIMEKDLAVWELNGRFSCVCVRRVEQISHRTSEIGAEQDPENVGEERVMDCKWNCTCDWLIDLTWMDFTHLTELATTERNWTVGRDSVMTTGWRMRIRRMDGSGNKRTTVWRGILYHYRKFDVYEIL